MASLTPDFAQHFAEEWIAAWNARDLDRILAHYADDFAMSSPLIAKVVGEPGGRLCGAQNVRAYWAKAMQMAPNLHFELLTVLLGVDSIALYYRRENGRLALEVFHFAADGKVEKAFAHYENA
ncbi:MAG: nuclear transport factor 2 family protein [Azonexus sp.]|jgi:ketosteroid isomerase-like protein|nr:nuclear transport factor 2 family protein [Azonexus sp.]